jgi:hypothetical protein
MSPYANGNAFLRVTNLPTGGSGSYLAQVQRLNNQANWENWASPINLANSNWSQQSVALPTQTQATFYRVMFTDSNNTSCSPTYSPVTRVDAAPHPTPGSIRAVGGTASCAGSPAPLLQSEVDATNFDRYYWGFTTAPDPNAANVTWTWMINATTASFQVPNNLTQTTHYRRGAASGSCGTVLSNIITITVAPAAQGGTIGNSVSVCPGVTPPTLRNLAPATGGSSAPTYRWQRRLPNGPWTNLATTGAELAFSAPLTETTFFRREADFGACGVQYSNEVKVTVFSNSGCSPISPEIPAFESAQRLNLFATLGPELDESFYVTDSNGFAYFKYIEAYPQPATSKLDCRLYTWERKEVGRITLNKAQGLNWYGLDLSAVCRPELCQPEQYYVMDVYDDNKRLTTLRIRFVRSNTPEEVVLEGPGDFCPGDVLTHRLTTIKGGVPPYRVTWTVNNQQPPSLIDQVQYGESVHTFQVTPALASLNSFPVRAVVVDANNRQIGQPQEMTVVKRDCTQPRATPVPAPPRIQVMFSIRQLILPRKF